MRILTQYVTSQVREDGVDLTQRQLAILCLIVEGREDASVKGLAKYLGIGKGVVSRALDVLEERHFVRRERDPDDLRNVTAIALAAGRRHIENLSRRLEELVAGEGKRAA